MRSALGFIAALTAISGISCSINRLNHRHSDGNQSLVTKAQDKFEATVSENAGIGPVLLKNLDTEMTLRSSVDGLRTELDETDFATMLTDKTWEGLRLRYFDAMGLRHAPPRTPDQTQALLTSNLEQRLLKVQSIGQVLDATPPESNLIIENAAGERKGVGCQFSQIGALIRARTFSCDAIGVPPRPPPPPPPRPPPAAGTGTAPRSPSFPFVWSGR